MGGQTDRPLWTMGKIQWWENNFKWVTMEWMQNKFVIRISSRVICIFRAFFLDFSKVLDTQICVKFLLHNYFQKEFKITIHKSNPLLNFNFIICKYYNTNNNYNLSYEWFCVYIFGFNPCPWPMSSVQLPPLIRHRWWLLSKPTIDVFSCG